MKERTDNEWLRFKVEKQQEDIDYLREVIAALKAELAVEKNKKNGERERGR